MKNIVNPVAIAMMNIINGCDLTKIERITAPSNTNDIPNIIAYMMVKSCLVKKEYTLSPTNPKAVKANTSNTLFGVY